MTTERWALVPVEATPEMLESAGTIAGWSGSVHMADVEHSDWYEDIVAASHGTALLAEVLAARDAAKLSAANRFVEDNAEPIPTLSHWRRLLDTLDKLGPAVEDTK